MGKVRFNGYFCIHINMRVTKVLDKKERRRREEGKKPQKIHGIQLAAYIHKTNAKLTISYLRVISFNLLIIFLLNAPLKLKLTSD